VANEFWLKFKSTFQAAAGWIARSATITNAIGLTWILVWVVLCVLVAQDLARDVVTIEPISVPKSLSENGYTPEVASHRLLDAVNHFATINRQSELMDALNIAPRDELPDFVVPKIDLSLNALVSSIRSVLHYGIGRRISGEIIASSSKLAVRIRVDGQQVYSSGFDSDNPDVLLGNAAPAVTDKIQPYVNAVAMYHDHPEKALDKADDIIAELKPSDRNVQLAYMLKGGYYFDKGDYDQSEKMLRTAISLDWSNPAPHVSLARTLWRRGKLDEAIAQCQRAAGINPKSAGAYNNWGLAVAEKARATNGPIDEAAALFHRAIAVDRNYPLAHNNLGLMLLRHDDLTGAADEFRRAVEIDPKYGNAHGNLAGVLRRQSKFDESISEYRHAIEIEPKNASLVNDLGVTFSAQGHLDEAMAQYRQAIAIDDKYAVAHNNLGAALSRQGNLDQASVELRRAIELAPKYANAHHGLAGVLRRQGNFDDAAAELRRTIELEPQNAVAYNDLGLVQSDQAHIDDAIANYRRAVQLDPNLKSAQENLERATQAQSAAK
jgi:Tfp pilus assembly protein PilF